MPVPGGYDPSIGFVPDTKPMDWKFWITVGVLLVFAGFAVKR